ncbi:MAG: hypothetical protein ACI92I_000096 [Acidimicrobiales bacterium]|jgi:hypothetical protein
MSNSDGKIIVATADVGAVLALLKQLELDTSLIFTTSGEPLDEGAFERLGAEVREILATRNLPVADVLRLMEKVVSEEPPVLALLDELFRPQKGLELFAPMEAHMLSDIPIIHLIEEKPHRAFDNGAEIRSAKGARKKQTRFNT